jgi:fumarate reductase flavoprotein subunit
MSPRILRAPLPSDTPHVAVAIVGAGACGLTSALLLHDASVDCAVLERDASPCGSTALSSGFIPAAGTRAQAAQGIEDDATRFAADIQNKTHGTAAAHLVAAYAQASGLAIDTLHTRHGLEFTVLDNFLYPGHHSFRMHCVPERTGAGLMARLSRAADKAEIPIVTRAQVDTLWLDDDGHGDHITGVSYTRPDGQVEHLGCDVLILACNGFGGNPNMVSELLPVMREAILRGARRQRLGARLADLGGYQGHGSWAVPQGALISWAIMMEGGVQLNSNGERFHDETQGYSEAAVAVLGQPGGIAWNVFDGELLALARSFPDFCDAEDAGAVKTCENPQELAKLIGCVAINSEAAYACFTRPAGQFPSYSSENTAATDGRVFKRALVAPYYAVKVTGALFHTQGGLDIDADCRVLRQNGVPFPNLLAAGGAARGVSGNAVWGYLSGNGLLSAVAGGYIAAQTAVQTIRERINQTQLTHAQPR